MTKLGFLCLLLSLPWGASAAPAQVDAVDGGYNVKTTLYTARVAPDGTLEKLTVNGRELLAAGTGGVCGAFTSDLVRKPLPLAKLSQDGNSVTAADDSTTLVYTFDDDTISLSGRHRGARGVYWNLLLSPEAQRVLDLTRGESAPTPLEARWSNVRFLFNGGPTLTVGNSSSKLMILGDGNNARQLFTVLLQANGSARWRIVLAPQPSEADVLSFSLGPEAPDHSFPAGKPVRFHLGVTNTGAAAFAGTAVLSLTDFRTGEARGQVEAPVAALAGKTTPADLVFNTLPVGFYNARFSLKHGDTALRSVDAVFVVGADQMPLPQPAPADLDAFWSGTLAEMRRQPLDAHLVEVKEASTDRYIAYKVDFALFDGIRTYGWYLVPRTPGRHAAMLSVPYSGVMATGAPTELADLGFAALAIGVHGLPVDLPSYQNRNYFAEGIETRESYIFRKIYCHSLRAVDFLASRPEVDPDRIGITGSSQGGMTALATAALDPRIRVCVGNAPALCRADWNGARIFLGRRFGANNIPGGMDAARRTLSYYDIGSLAPRVHCPVILSTGLQDRNCPPDGVASIYTALPAQRKKLMIFPWMPHAIDGAFIAESNRWICDILHPEVAK